MDYSDALKRFFKSPKWTMNIVLAAVCVLIPVVGAMVLTGYCLGAIVRQLREPDAAPPDFDFGRFVDYLTRGVWPFLVGLVAGLAVFPLIAVAALPLVLLLVLPEGPLWVIPFAGTAVLYVLAIFAVNIIMIPLTLHAGLAQEFGAAFSLAFVRDFLRLVWREAVAALLFLMVIAIPLGICGYLACFVGVYPVAAYLTFVSWQFYLQLYRLYLERGGAPVAVKAELAADP